MKLSKVLSLVLAIAMLFSVPTFAAFTDVPANADYAEAVTVLSALEIINGYGDGSFKPDGKITRAEYAAIVCRAIGMGDIAKGGVSTFTDVPADHWATGYIATAQNAKIVNGKTATTFDPEAEVTYEQAVKMLVVALGYELKAQSMGGYPTGYMMIANQESITVGTTNTPGGASRATVARLTYNALTVPMMDQTAWGSETKFEPIKTQSLLWTKLNAVKADVVVVDVPLDKAAKDITLTPTKYDSVATANTFSLAGNVEINGVDLTGLQGLEVTAIIDKTIDTDPKLVCIVPKAGKNDEITVEPAMMAEISTADGYVEYYKTNDDDRTSKIKVPTAGLTTYTNLVRTGAIAQGGASGDLAYRFVDRDNDGTFETVYIDKAHIFVVGNVSTAAGKIYRDSAATALATVGAPATITLDEEDDKLDWTITDVEGNVLALEDIKAGDVVAVATSTDAQGNTYYEIVVSNEVIKGTIGEIYAETAKVTGLYGTTLNKFKVNDEAYMLLNNTTMTPGDEIVAKVFGDKVVSYTVAEGVKNYGMIIATNTAQDFGTTYQLQILTQKGELVTLNLADKVNGSATDYAPATTLAADFPKGDLIAYELNAAGEVKAFDVETKTFAVGYTKNVLEAGDKFTTYNAATQYKEASEKLGSYFITEDTVIFTTEVAKASVTKTKVALGSADFLSEDNTYKTVILYDENKEADVVVLFEASNQVNMNSYPLVVTKKATVSVDNASRTKLFGYVNGEEVEYIVAETVTGDVASLDLNDIAMFAVNAAGEINNAIMVADYDAANNRYAVKDNATAGALDDCKTDVAANAVYLNFGTAVETALAGATTATGAQTAAATLMGNGGAAGTLKGFGVAGKAYDISGKNFRVMNVLNYAATFDGTTTRDYTNIVDDDRITDYSVNSNAVAYKFNAKNGKFTVTTMLDTETDVNTFDAKNGAQLDNDDLVYAYNYDGETKLVLIIDVMGK